MPANTNLTPLQIIQKYTEEAAKKFKIETYDVSPAQFWAVATGKIAEWQVRKLGGYTAIRTVNFPAPVRPQSRVFTPQASNERSPRYKPAKLENFTVHGTDLYALFRAAKLPKDGFLRLVVQPDTHVPEHDETAVKAFCSFIEDYKPHGIVNLGDFMEMGAVAHWSPHTASPRRLVPEVLKAREVLQQIEDALGPQCVYKRFLVGNHEDWLDQMCVDRIPEIYDNLEDLGVNLRIQDLIGLKDFGYRVVPLNEILQIGDLNFIHGYYTGKHHASKHLEVFGVNLIYGHTHDTQSFSGVSVKGMHEAQSIGCLRTLNAPFLKGKPNNWSHAFGIIEMRINGQFTKYVPHIIDGKFSFNGKSY